MAYFTVKTSPEEEGARYEVPTTLTYGEQIDVFREFGSDAAALGVIWIAVRRRFPNVKIEDLRDATIEIEEDDEDSKLPPTFFAANGSSEASEKQTELDDTGSPGSDTSSA